ncbi:MAG: tyrosine-type recombinase/integrase [Wohlfahrtiimonas sp.]
MASFEKVGNRWKAVIRLKPHPKRTKTFDTKREAKEWAVDYEAKLRVGVDESQIKLITFASVILRYLDEVSVKKKSLKSEKQRLNKFLIDFRHLAEKSIIDLTRADVAKWRDERLKTVSGSSVNREWSNLSTVFSYAVKGWGLPLQDNPFRNVNRPPSSKPRNQRVSEDEIALFITKLDYSDGGAPVTNKQKTAWCFLFAIETAMRAGEILKLEKDDINNRIAILRDTKNGDDRRVPLSKKAMQLIDLLPNGFPVEISSRNLDATFRRHRDARVRHINFHDTRHEALTRMAKKIPNPMDLAKISGHKDLKILLNTYYNPDDDHLVSLLD